MNTATDGFDEPKKKKFDRKAFASGENRAGAEENNRKQTQFPLKKPGSKNFFRVCTDPESRAYGVNVLEGTMGKLSIVTQDIVDQNADVAARVKSRNLYVCINHNGDFFVWPVGNDGSLWSQSALKAIQVAEKQWLRIHPNGFAQGYDHEVVSAAKYPVLAAQEPAWLPAGSEILDGAMEACAITDINDASLQELLKGLK
ncbi:MAG: hypothetical protein ACLP07_15815 [Terracidiphilus sp.]